MFGSMPFASITIATSFFSFGTSGNAIIAQGIHGWVVFIDGGAGFVKVA